MASIRKISRSSASRRLASVARSLWVSADSAGAGAATGAPLSAIAVTAASSATVPAVSSAPAVSISGSASSSERFLRLHELRVVDQRGVVDQVPELRDQRGARRGIGRRPPDFGDEPGQHAAQILDGVLDRLRRAFFRARSFAESLRQKRRDQPPSVGTLLLHRLDEEAEPAQRFREKLEVAVADRRVRVRIAVDLLFAKPQQVLGFVLLQHLKRAADLVTVLAQRRDFGALRRVAEERVEHLLHPAQVDLYLAGHLREQHTLLGTAKDAVDQRRRCRPGSHAIRARRRGAAASPRPASESCSRGSP